MGLLVRSMYIFLTIRNRAFEVAMVRVGTADEERWRRCQRMAQLWTDKSTWFSNEVGKKGRVCVGQLADAAVLDQDYFGCPEDRIRDITSVLTIVGGKPVYGAEEFAGVAPALPPAMLDWAPPNRFGGYRPRLGADQKYAALCACDSRCNVHGHAHLDSWGKAIPASDAQGFWGALGCSCFAV